MATLILRQSQQMNIGLGISNLEILYDGVQQE